MNFIGIILFDYRHNALIELFEKIGIKTYKSLSESHNYDCFVYLQKYIKSNVFILETGERRI